MKFRKKPIEIDAIQWTGDNHLQIQAFFIGTDKVSFNDAGTAYIDTPEGIMKANAGDWIIKEETGEFYLCEPNTFERTYEVIT